MPRFPPWGILTMDYQLWGHILASKSGTPYVGMTTDICPFGFGDHFLHPQSEV